MTTTKSTQRDNYFTSACACGANPALHIGHTQACADKHYAVRFTIGSRVIAIRSQVTGVVVASANGEFQMRWDIDPATAHWYGPDEIELRHDA
jgi:hypothetical protein